NLLYLQNRVSARKWDKRKESLTHYYHDMNRMIRIAYPNESTAFRLQKIREGMLDRHAMMYCNALNDPQEFEARVYDYDHLHRTGQSVHPPITYATPTTSTIQYPENPWQTTQDKF